MILYTLKKYVNEKLSAANGKFFAYPVITQTYGLDELAEHMESHNTPFSKGAIKGMLTDMVSCVRELVLQGIAVKIPDLAIFSIGIKISFSPGTMPISLSTAIVSSKNNLLRLFRIHAIYFCKNYSSINAVISQYFNK